jgi:hypothetical protein
LSRHLHIVCLDVPWPADYGGAIDMMNRIKSFKNKGVLIHLHYFSYNERGTPNELNAFCETIHVYPRKNFGKSFSLNIPYYIASRMNHELEANLSKDNYPILLEGLHTTGILKHMNTMNRKICVRLHNEESRYYRELARNTRDPLKKLYYRYESHLTKKYIKTLPDSCLYACISDIDKVYMQRLGYSQVETIPAFPSWQKINGTTGIGNFSLFHGNLSVPENEKAAMWLLCNVFNKVRVPFVIAGKNPSRRLQKAATLCLHTCIVSNPGEEEINDLIQKAHINVLPLLNKKVTGIRLKLLHALFEGRHCVTTPSMVEGTGLESTCHIGKSAKAIASIISQLYYQPFNNEEILLRKRLLNSAYNNEKNIEKFIDFLWENYQ